MIFFKCHSDGESRAESVLLLALQNIVYKTLKIISRQ